MKPAAGATITLFFEPNGKSTVTAVDSTLMLSHHGTWSYTGGKLTIDFTASDFHPDATFALDLGSTQVTMPFQVFSTAAGSSTWAQTSVDIVSGAFNAGYGLASDPIVPCVTTYQVVAEAAEYISARTGVTPKSDGTVSWPPTAPEIPNTGICATSGGGGDDAGMGRSVTPKRQLRMFSGPDSLAGTQGTESSAATEAPALHPLGTPVGPEPGIPVTGITVSPTGLTLWFGSVGLMEEIPFFSFLQGNVNQTYTLAALAGDPRTDLIPMSPGNGSDDPPKTALLVAPIIKPWLAWSESAFVPGVIDAVGTSGYAGSISTPMPNLSAIKSKLVAKGYTVTILDDEPGNKPGTVLEITKALLESPGFIQVYTHGSADGGLITADYFGADDQETIHANFLTLKSQMQMAYPGFPQGAIAWQTMDMAPGHSVGLGVLTPTYWNWLRTMKGVDFSHSLVYMGACLTAASSALSEAIRAKAYFAFNETITYELVQDVALYLPDLMSRPTTSAEEVYYNMVRIAHTQEFIYLPQDKDFQGAGFPYLPEKITPTIDFSPSLVGYGWEGEQATRYLGNGWLSGGSLDDGQIFYLVWAARWGQNSVTGAENLVDCYNQYWKDGNLGGLADPYCQNANAGTAPTQDEVAYATYLLTGTAALGFSGTLVPRFTLDDGE
jgi:hypothetical protein